jgi:outer membrane lipoprotein-sorting protein
MIEGLNTMNTKIMKISSIFINLLVFLTISAFSQDAQALLVQIDRNLMPESYEAYRKVIDIESNGRRKEYFFYSVKKGRDKTALLFLAPASEKDRAMLRIGDSMWLYIPSVGRPIRQTSLQSVTGGIFNNSDILALDLSVEYNAKLLSQDEREYVLDLKAKTQTVSYARVKLWVIKKDLIVKKMECYSATNILLKTLEFRELKDFGRGVIRPAVIETTSPLYQGYRSLMIISKVKQKEFPDEVFTLPYMSKLKDLK